MNSNAWTRVPNWIWTVEGLSVRERWLLATLFAFWGPHGIFPSLSTLQRYAWMSRPWVVKILKRLEEKGFIKVERSRGKVNRYVITVNQGGEENLPEWLTQLTSPVNSVNPTNTTYNDYLQRLSIKAHELVKRLGERLGVGDEFIPKDEEFYRRRKEEIRRQYEQLVSNPS